MKLGTLEMIELHRKTVFIKRVAWIQSSGLLASVQTKSDSVLMTYWLEEQLNQSDEDQD